MLPLLASAPTTLNADERTTLARRMARFGLAGCALGLLALVFRLPAFIVAGHVDLSFGAHVAGIATSAGVWLLARRIPLTRSGLRVVDAAGTLLTSIAYGFMGWSLCRGTHKVAAVAELVLLLVLTYVVALRAALVPSSARRTLFVTAAAAVALVPVCATSPLGFARSFVGALMWWTLATALATITSGVIYGLRREVKTAREIGQYQLIEKIGQGGMGVVYRARHRLLRRDTALKLLPPSRTGVSAIGRFEREVRLTAQLTHPNTVTVFDYGRTPEGLFYYAMELLDGATLEDVVRVTGKMPPARVAHILRQVAGALAEAHELGLVHRDVKPSNIMLCSRGGQPDVAKVLDFGLVRDKIEDASAIGLSMPSEILGTPQYMAPEAILSPESVSASSDLYSLGAVAYFLLTGRPVFEAITLVEICSHHLHTEAPPPSSRVAVPPSLDALVRACLEKDPAARPESARTIAALLEELDTRWTDADARAWWEANMPALQGRFLERREPRGKRDGRGGRENGERASLTLEVDLDRRGMSQGATMREPPSAGEESALRDAG